MLKKNAFQTLHLLLDTEFYIDIGEGLKELHTRPILMNLKENVNRTTGMHFVVSGICNLPVILRC